MIFNCEICGDAGIYEKDNMKLCYEHFTEIEHMEEEVLN